jgi:sporulation-control protein
MVAAARVFGEEAVFRELLSSIGVGGARVDTRLGAESFVPEGPVSGEVYITGGDAQGFNRIYLSVVNYKHEDFYP